MTGGPVIRCCDLLSKNCIFDLINNSMCVSCNQSISCGDIQDLKTGCFIKQNPARAAGFLFVVVSFRFTFVVSAT